MQAQISEESPVDGRNGPAHDLVAALIFGSNVAHHPKSDHSAVLNLSLSRHALRVFGQEILEKGAHPMTVSARNHRIIGLTVAVILFEGPVAKEVESPQRIGAALHQRRFA